MKDTFGIDCAFFFIVFGTMYLISAPFFIVLQMMLMICVPFFHRLLDDVNGFAPLVLF